MSIEISDDEENPSIFSTRLNSRQNFKFHKMCGESSAEDNPCNLLYCVECGFFCTDRDDLERHLSVFHLLYFPFHCGKCRDCFPTRKQLLEHFQDEGHHQPHIMHDRDKGKLNRLKFLMAKCEAVAAVQNVPKDKAETKNMETDTIGDDFSAGSVVGNDGNCLQTPIENRKYIEKAEKCSKEKKKRKRKKEKSSDEQQNYTVPEKESESSKYTTETRISTRSSSRQPSSTRGKRSRRNPVATLEREKRELKSRSPCKQCKLIPVNRESHIILHLRQIDGNASRKEWSGRKIEQMQLKCFPPRIMTENEIITLE